MGGTNDSKARFRNKHTHLANKINHKKHIGGFRFTTPNPEPREEPVLAPVESESPVTLEQLELGHCRWPVKDGFYCGNKRDSIMKPYCTHHMKAAYYKTPRQQGKPNYGNRKFQ